LGNLTSFQQWFSKPEIDMHVGGKRENSTEV